MTYESPLWHKQFICSSHIMNRFNLIHQQVEDAHIFQLCNDRKYKSLSYVTTKNIYLSK